MPSLFATEKAGRNAWEVRRAAYGSPDKRDDGRKGDGFASYTIEYITDDQTIVVSPMMFSDKEIAVANACALLRAGYFVSRVAGPDFEMDHVALAVLDQSKRNT